MPDTPQHSADALPKVLADLDQVAPPDILYHYTDQRGLLGIIEKKCIWATQVHHLNDRHELTHACRLAKEEVDARLTNHPNEVERNSLDRIKETISHIESAETAIASFSCDGDLLSQWRAYGGSTGGFSIGFSGPGLRGIATGDVKLIRCEYDPSTQKPIVAALIDDAVARAKSGSNAIEEIIRDSILWQRYAPVLKDKAFAAEHEWRLITGPILASDERLGFRESRSMIAPYLRIDIKDVEIKQVVVGPTVRHQESRRAVEKLIHRCYPSTIRVALSTVPYRNW